ncbi:hypothetical protein HDU76_003340, partial [Blyttiomyces sp. JEL0837]
MQLNFLTLFCTLLTISSVTAAPSNFNKKLARREVTNGRKAIAAAGIAVDANVAKPEGYGSGGSTGGGGSGWGSGSGSDWSCKTGWVTCNEGCM